MSWSDRARVVVARVKRETGLQGDALRKELVKHYPFGPREGFPYKAWLRVVKEYCGAMPKIPNQERFWF
jgi:hypothetical protein